MRTEKAEHTPKPPWQAQVQCFDCHALFQVDGWLCVSAFRRHGGLKTELQELRAVISLQTATCPTCRAKRNLIAGTRLGTELGCPFCLRAFKIDDDLFGQHVLCPECSSEIAVCRQADFRRNAHSAFLKILDSNGQRWRVFASEGSPIMELTKRQDLIDAIVEGRVRGDHVVVKFELAPPISMKDLCNQEFSLRKLYDPAGTIGVVIGVGAGVIFGITVGVLVAVLLHADNPLEAMMVVAVVGSLFGILSYWISWKLLKRLGWLKPKVTTFL